MVGADTLRDLVTLTFELLTLDSGQTWQVTWSRNRVFWRILRQNPSGVLAVDDLKNQRNEQIAK